MSGNLLYEQQEIIVILLKYISPQQTWGNTVHIYSYVCACMVSNYVATVVS